jgi:hypothetical protein
VGHRLQGEATVLVGERTLADAERIAGDVVDELREHLRTLDAVTVTPVVR